MIHIICEITVFNRVGQLVDCCADNAMVLISHVTFSPFPRKGEGEVDVEGGGEGEGEVT